MDNFFASLRRFFYLASVPALGLFLICYLMADEVLLPASGVYLCMVILDLIALVSVFASSWFLRHSISKYADAGDGADINKLARAYRIRVVSLNVAAYLAGPAYLCTLDQSCIFLFAIIEVVLLLSFPTRKYLMPADE